VISKPSFTAILNNISTFTLMHRQIRPSTLLVYTYTAQAVVARNAYILPCLTTSVRQGEGDGLIFSNIEDGPTIVAQKLKKMA
jgi:hypothetical protein